MGRLLAPIVFASAVAFGGAEAAPSFGESSHRIGGGQSANESGRTLSALEAAMAVFGLDFTASVNPLAREGVADGTSKPKECDRAKKTEVAKTEAKPEAEGGSSKGRSRTGEPVYLAF